MRYIHVFAVVIDSLDLRNGRIELLRSTKKEACEMFIKNLKATNGEEIKIVEYDIYK